MTECMESTLRIHLRLLSVSEDYTRGAQGGRDQTLVDDPSPHSLSCLVPSTGDHGEPLR